jgi:hypothetical protein
MIFDAHGARVPALKGLERSVLVMTEAATLRRRRSVVADRKECHSCVCNRG